MADDENAARRRLGVADGAQPFHRQTTRRGAMTTTQESAAATASAQTADAFAVGPTGQAAPAPAKPTKLPREQDPRNPNKRLAAFFDPGSVELISEDNDCGMLAAVGTVDGTHTVAFCSDATVMGGAMGNEGCAVVVRAYKRAIADDAPIVGLWHSGGARLAEGVLSLHAVGLIFHAMTQASGKVPQIS